MSSSNITQQLESEQDADKVVEVIEFNGKKYYYHEDYTKSPTITPTSIPSFSPSSSPIASVVEPVPVPVSGNRKINFKTSYDMPASAKTSIVLGSLFMVSSLALLLYMKYQKQTDRFARRVKDDFTAYANNKFSKKDNDDPEVPSTPTKPPKSSKHLRIAPPSPILSDTSVDDSDHASDSDDNNIENDNDKRPLSPLYLDEENAEVELGDIGSNKITLPIRESHELDYDVALMGLNQDGLSSPTNNYANNLYNNTDNDVESVSTRSTVVSYISRKFNSARSFVSSKSLKTLSPLKKERSKQNDMESNYGPTINHQEYVMKESQVKSFRKLIRSFSSDGEAPFEDEASKRCLELLTAANQDTSTIQHSPTLSEQNQSESVNETLNDTLDELSKQDVIESQITSPTDDHSVATSIPYDESAADEDDIPNQSRLPTKKIQDMHETPLEEDDVLEELDDSELDARNISYDEDSVFESHVSHVFPGHDNGSTSAISNNVSMSFVSNDDTVSVSTLLTNCSHSMNMTETNNSTSIFQKQLSTKMEHEVDEILNEEESDSASIDDNENSQTPKKLSRRPLMNISRQENEGSGKQQDNQTNPNSDNTKKDSSLDTKNSKNPSTSNKMGHGKENYSRKSQNVSNVDII